MADMLTYQIVKIGDLPGDETTFSSEGGTCAEWSQLNDKAEKEVVAIDLTTGAVRRRYPPSESERIALDFRNARAANLQG